MGRLREHKSSPKVGTDRRGNTCIPKHLLQSPMFSGLKRDRKHQLKGVPSPAAKKAKV